MTASAETLREAREAAGLSAREAAALVGVTTLTWQRWEGQSSRTTEIPYAHWNLFLLLTGSHPIYRLEKKMLTREQVAAMNADIEIKADFAQASSLIQYRLRGETDWKGTPFQVADAAHSDASALRLVDEWLERQG